MKSTSGKWPTLGSVEANSASLARVHCVWEDFGGLSGILTRKDVSLTLKGKVYATCVRNTIV